MGWARDPVHAGLALETTRTWNPVENQYGALAPIYGTLVTWTRRHHCGAGDFRMALFLYEIAPTSWRGPVASAIELFASIPSIIYGMWGLFIFVPFMANRIEPILADTLGRLPVVGALFDGPQLGLGVLTAGIVLAVMMIPFISLVMREVFQTVPARLKEVGLRAGLHYLGGGLGYRPAVHPLGGDRGHVPRTWPCPWRNHGGDLCARQCVRDHRVVFMPGTSISSSIANEFNEAVGLHRSALIALGFLLFVVTSIVLMIARLMLRHMSQKEGN